MEPGGIYVGLVLRSPGLKYQLVHFIPTYGDKLISSDLLSEYPEFLNDGGCVKTQILGPASRDFDVLNLRQTPEIHILSQFPKQFQCRECLDSSEEHHVSFRQLRDVHVTVFRV